MSKGKIGFFAKYLSIWVLMCIILGVAIGHFLPIVPKSLQYFEIANVSLPVAILIWLMIYPMMLKVDFKSILSAGKKPKGLVITLIINWLIKPFTMYAIAWLFLKIIFKAWIPDNLSTEYIAGAVLLGAAPCTAMVFVWSYLSEGNPSYTVVQVAINDLIILFAFAPIVALLLGVSNVQVPLMTLSLSVVLFVLIPLVAGMLSRSILIKTKGLDWFNNVFTKKFDGITELGLLLTLIIIFSFQGDKILSYPLAIILIAVPLIFQTYFIFFLGFIVSRFARLPYNIAAPSCMIGASNFFELAVAVSISLFGIASGAALATVVGVLVEVPIMLSLVAIMNKSKLSWQTKEL
ncbi:ACR3 family arsenite efflux transporter [Spirochaeta cellobiosiphila]|uniref:ACR3 family arsenite efflux transporter n=1 Tax=Spirochaeta cellobiosiphila TaxID=504483 RepID=UPI000427B1D9|nr:ACR3 family arsenite efflux transporter [Spirochaeta cellobiosiphila]